MNVKKLMLNTLLMGAVAVAPVGLSSCDDDDDGGDNNEPDVSEGEANSTLTGDAEDNISADGNINVSSGSFGGTDATVITWADANGNSVTATVAAIDETGTYSADPNDGEGSVVVTYDGDRWESEGGNIGIATNNDNRIAGTLNDVKLSPASGDGSVTLNGEFNASKSGSGSENQITLQGAAEDTLTFEQASLEVRDQPVNHKNIGLGSQQGSAASIQIVPADASTGELDLVMQGNIGGDDTPDSYSSMTVTYNGDTWMATGQGTVNVNTNDSTSVDGELNDVVLSPDGSDDEVTVNGTFAASN